ncbi:uncharacterized protein LOC143915052 [Arctopsyche grandis]|uniref:uncharacterized protein LOC143915052 n=1 Tax=Arctopsyche grandis TaxID=121162 RepID=UPI00406D6C98
MTIKNILQNPGLSGVKNAFDRFHHNAPMDHGYYGGPNNYNGGLNGYNYHPPPSYQAPPAGPIIKHYKQSSSGGGNKGAGSAAMSALTLLSFLFFLNILQQCLKDHMMTLNPQVTIMSAGREDPQLKNINVRTSTHIENSGEHTLGDGIGRAYPSELNEDAKDVRGHEVRIDALNIEQATGEIK